MHIVIDSEQFMRTLKRMTHEIIERNTSLQDIILVGIEKKGTPFAREIKEFILDFEGIDVPLEVMDISSHRDDDKKLEHVHIEFQHSVENKTIILVDDVLYTGRSVRAAMDAIMDLGRPAKIELAVFVDRGHRELPIRADFIGKNLPTSKAELVLCDFDGRTVSII